VSLVTTYYDKKGKFHWVKQDTGRQEQNGKMFIRKGKQLQEVMAHYIQNAFLYFVYL